MATYTDTAELVRDMWPAGQAAEGRNHVERAATIAYNFINSRLSGIYSVPFSATYPVEVVDISDIMTRIVSEWINARGRLPKMSDVDEETGFLSPLGWLDRIRSGEMGLVGHSRLSTAGPYLSTEDEMHVFDIDSELDHAPDSDRLDDLADDRKSYP